MNKSVTAAAGLTEQSADSASALSNRLIELEAGRGKSLVIDSESDRAIVSTWVSKCVTVQQLNAAHGLAAAARARDGDRRVIYVAFVNKFIAKVQAAGSVRDPEHCAVAWFGTCEGVDARGAELGVRARKPGEQWQFYRVLVAAASRDDASMEAVLKDAQRFNSSDLYHFARKTFGDTKIRHRIKRLDWLI